MRLIEKINITTGVFWIGIPDADLYILCGCPADVVKHLIKNGLIKSVEIDGVQCESGPNAILLSDVAVQNGEFSNLAEFPVLQMLYRQGMILPNHPNNDGSKPILMGRSTQVQSQLKYIYRGNYGLSTVEEMLEAGLTKEQAEQNLRMKQKFAFGKIKTADEFVEALEIENTSVEIKNGVSIRRIGFNNYEISYKDEKINVDLNLPSDCNYEPPFRLGYYKTYREHFAVVHSGEGDGWDINSPCMGSVIVYNGYVYLVDAGPNIKQILNSLGISIPAIHGIFHTHAHDDHFSGLTTLIQSDHKIKYFAAKKVRHSVDKKLTALLGIDNVLDRFFDVHELEENEWNNTEGLEVKPIPTPHPVENTMFYFRVIADKGYKTYYHMADTSSFKVLESMVTKDPSVPGISEEYLEQVKKDYLIPADLKKIDIGGGMIHGTAEDFKDDQSDRIILSHTGRRLSNQEKEIGERSSFGQVDVLIKANNHSIYRFAEEYFKAYYPDLEKESFKDLLNCRIVTFNPGTIMLKQGGDQDYFYMSLTGTVEVIHTEKQIHQYLSAGSMIGEMSALLNLPREKTYVANGYVSALQIPANLYRAFAEKYGLYENIKKSRKNKSFLGSMWLFQEIASSPTINKLSQSLMTKNVKEGTVIKIPSNNSLLVVMEGEISYSDQTLCRNLREGEFCLEQKVLNIPHDDSIEILAQKDTKLAFIPASFLENVPAVMWKLLEFYERNKSSLDKIKKAA